MRKYLAQKAVGVALLLSMSTGICLPSTTEASVFTDVLETVVGGAVAMSQINDQVKQLDGEQRNQFFQQIKDKNGVNDEPEANEQLERIMTNLSPVLAKYDPSVAEKPYNYFVNNDESFNAFCTLGHNVSVNIGLFKTLNYQEDEIAFVLGHELSHGTHHDPANGVQQQVGVQVLAGIVAASAGGGTLVNLGAAIAANLGTAKGVTLPMEKRADKDAFIYCSEAGYNVGAGAAVWQRIIEMTSQNKQETSVINQLFNPSDHPSHVNRRNKYNDTVYEYSNKLVKVDKETGEISVGKTKVGVPAATEDMSAQERAYLVAGYIAEVYHDNDGAPVQAYSQDGQICLGDQAVMNIMDGDDAIAWVTNLNFANSRIKK